MLPQRAALWIALALPAFSQHGDGDYQPEVAPASDEPLEALAGFQVPEGFSMELWAAEPLLANPVAFCLDAAGRCFVAETFRVHAGVTDMRSHMDWLHDELAAKTVEDRVAFMRKHEGERFDGYSAEHERVRLITDTDGDGSADQASVFADGFATPASGIAAGLLARGDDLYYTCIPDLWRLTDADGDGVAESRESLHTGYGVKIALLGHDMHGLRVGPDGRLYYSIGDRGLHVEHAGGTLALSDRGAVLRCELDGSNLELFATGLRNPQELVFDDHGNLFTGDNNSDGGDRARWVYVQKGGDSGWRHHYQYVTQPNRRGPWNAERCWEPHHPEQPVYLTPPVANFADGPSGLTYYPGAIWGPEWDGTFFLCDFRGAARGSGVYAFQNEPKGAGFALVNDRKFLWDTLVTDVDFGPDGRMWASDWVASWGMTGKGRIWRLAPADAPAEAQAEVQRLLAEGMGERSLDELSALCSHGHREVRQEAHLELALRSLPERNDATLTLLRLAADRNGSRFARLHGVWGLGMVARRAAWDARVLLGALLADPDPEIRAQALRAVGDTPYPGALQAVLRALEAKEPRVRAMAAEALGALGSAEHGELLLALLERDAALDPWVRTAAIHALERLCSPEQVLGMAQAQETGTEARRCLAAVLRRQESPLVAELLSDPEESVQAEAARAIYDVPIPGALPALADHLQLDRALPQDAYLLRRCLAAMRAWRVGQFSHAGRLVGVLGREDLPLPARKETLGYLSEWASPSPVDPVHGAWRPIPNGSTETSALGPGLEELVADLVVSGRPAPWTGCTSEWIELVRSLGVGPGSALLPGLAAIVQNRALDGALRSEALTLLVDRRYAASAALMEAALEDADPIVRAAGYGGLARADEPRALRLLTAAALEGEAASRQFAVQTLAGLGAAGQAAVVQLAAGASEGGHGAIGVELLEALDGTQGLDELYANDPGALVLRGGDPEAGRAIFLENAEAQCLKCHVVGVEGSSQVGPALDGVAGRLEPELLLQSLLEPNAVLAEGYENWILALADGTMLVGRILEEGPEGVSVLDAEGETFSLGLDEIEGRRRDVSAMPAGLTAGLTPRQLRDLLAYLQAL